MKQTDRCECCGKERQYHSLTNQCPSFGFGFTNIWKFTESHSQNGSPKKVVRNTEEKTIGKTSDTTQSFGVSSSVPYTPLTKEHNVRTRLLHGRMYPGGTWCSFCRKELCINMNHKAYDKEDVLSALNGLRQDLNKIDNNDMIIITTKDNILNLIDKWFKVE